MFWGFVFGVCAIGSVCFDRICVALVELLWD